MAAVANVAINVDSRGAASKLREVANRSKEVDKAVQKMNGNMDNASNAIVRTGRSAQQAQRGFNGLIGSVGKLAAAYVTLNAAQSAVSAGIRRIESERRIQFLAKQYGEVDQLARAAANASDRFGQSQTTANKAVADIYARLRPVGVSLENIVSVYNGFNTAARISGSTAVEAENAFRQLSQALGSGALRGDEFNSIAEQVPGILTAISQETGVAQGKLREYAAEGKITADVVIAALQRIEKDGADQLKEALGGPEQAIRDFQNAAEDVQVALTTAIVPEIARAFRDLAAIIEGLEPALRFIGGLIAESLAGYRGLVDSISGVPVVERLRQGGQLSGFNVRQEKEQLRSFFGKERFAELEKQAKETADATLTPFREALGERLRVAIKVADRAKEIEARQATTIPTRPFRVGDIIDESTVAGGKVGGAGGRSAASIAKEQERIAEAAAKEAEQRRINLRNQDQLIERLRSKIVLQNSFTDGDRIMNKLLMDQLEIRQDIENRMEGASAAMKQRLIEEARLRNQLAMDVAAEPFMRAGMNMGEALAEGLGKANQQADVFKETMQGVGEIMGGAITNAIDGLINGTADLNKMLSDVLNQVGSLLIRSGLNTLAGSDGAGILSFLGFGARANGGPVTGGSPYIVGERGPELFIPFQSGRVASNEDTQQLLGQASTVQLPFTRNAETASAMQSSSEIKVKYESTVVNGVEYVTAEQHRKGMAQAAERGRALALSALQNSVKARKQAGIL